MVTKKLTASECNKAPHYCEAFNVVGEEPDNERGEPLSLW
ncbi:hypothetical protein A6A12_1986 [Vibrio anguillarum]|nr:hypothetical protein A6A12_1986 [Vibrio anguillarum]